MKKYLFSSLILVSSVHALLPPLYETLHQFQGLLNDPILVQKLNSGEAIESIQKEDDQFIVTTNKQVLKVKVEALPQTMPGPAHYQYVFGEPVTR